ncbi:C40 family peptidase [Corynebacterium sp. AOP12-C2-36]|uniref:C40 family peptidase n=1 Tax=Corynebacterium sp. AOP12-C2-36 TaxID=3457723 RepID=UPI004033D90F
MPQDVSSEHEEFQELLDRAQELNESGGDYAVEGLDGQVDPEILAALRAEEAEEAEQSERDAEDVESARRMDDELKEVSEEGARSIDSVDTDELARDSASPGLEAMMAQAASEQAAQQAYSPPSAAAGPILPGTMVGGASPTGTYDQAAALAQMQQPGLVDYGNYQPTPQVSTQYDTYNAPNREELIQAIMEYAEGEYSDEEYADNDEYTAGGGTVSPLGEGATASERAVKELAQEYVDLKQDYTWGGGHGAEPGPSQGTTDGGGAADANGDYNKVGMDCSGLSRDFIYNLSGVDIGPGPTGDQIANGQPVDENDLQPGDLVFPHSGHVQVYIGDGQVVEAQQSGTQYMISEYQPGAEYIRRFVDVEAES